MSEKKRQKKAGERKDKKNKAMHERENDRTQRANSPQKARAISNLTDAEPGAAGASRKRR